MTASTHPAPLQRDVSLTALWFGLFGAPVAWSIQEMVGYAVVAHGCYPAADPKLVAMPNLWTIDLIVSVVMLVVGGLATLVGYRSWTWTRGAMPLVGSLEHGEGRVHFMALCGLILSLVFVFSMIMNTIALFLQPVCV